MCCGIPFYRTKCQPTLYRKAVLINFLKNPREACTCIEKDSTKDVFYAKFTEILRGAIFSKHLWKDSLMEEKE